MSESAEPPAGWRRHLWFLTSRKVQIAVATIIAAAGAQWGLAVNTEVLLSIVGVGVAIILGIAIEDGGAKTR